MAGMEGSVKCGKITFSEIGRQVKRLCTAVKCAQIQGEMGKKYNPTVEEIQSGSIGEMDENGSVWLQPFDVNKSLWFVLL